MRRNHLLAFLLGWISVIIAVAASAAAATAQPRLLRDIDPRLVDPDRSPAPVTRVLPVGSRALFVVDPSASSLDRPMELWGTDGTPAGTERLATGSETGFAFTFLGTSSRLTYFLQPGQDTVSGHLRISVRRTDGTSPGTLTLTTFLVPDPARYFDSPGAVLGERLYFAGCTPETGCEPWSSDGSPEGTRRIRDLTPGEFGSDPRAFTLLGPLVYFFANDPEGTSLWRTDGSRPGTVRVATLPPFSNPGSLRAAGSRLYFLVGEPPGFGQAPRLDLWTSDGTVGGTRPLPPFGRGQAGGPSAAFLGATVGGAQVFLGIDRASGAQLWRTDGSARGTRPLTAFPAPGLKDLAADGVETVGDRIVFAGPRGEPWSSRGTRATTRPLVACGRRCPVTVDAAEAEPRFTAAAGRLYFRGIDGAGDEEPWVTDGSPAGTYRVIDACPGACPSRPRFSVGRDGRIFFSDDDGRLWASDGTPAGTALLLDGEPAVHLGPAALAAVGRGDAPARAVFAVTSAARGTEIWITAGTAATTRAVARASDGVGSGAFGFTPLAGGAMFYACDRGSSGLWFSRGDAPSTLELAGNGLCFDPPSFLFSAPVGGIAFFTFYPSGHFDSELWRTDGTPAGTAQLTHFDNQGYVTDLIPWRDKLLFASIDDSPDGSSLWLAEPGSTTPTRLMAGPGTDFSRLRADGDRFFFVRSGPQQQFGLWTSDGTAAGTIELANLGFSSPTPYLASSAHLGDATYLVLTGTPAGLWRSDGTPAGTERLLPSDRLPPEIGSPSDLTLFRGALYYLVQGDLDALPSYLVRSDGSVGGTAVVRAFGPGELSLPPSSHLTATADALYFIVNDGVHGDELWRSDGTAAGTALVKDIFPGRDGSRIEQLFAAGNRVFFGADDGEHGVELWTSDGTAAGTLRLTDLAQGSGSSFPRDFAVSASILYFSADDGVAGREPWVLPLDGALTATHQVRHSIVAPFGRAPHRGAGGARAPGRRPWAPGPRPRPPAPPPPPPAPTTHR